MTDDIQYRQVPENHRISLLDEMYVEKGTIDDWHLLEALHYKSAALGVGPRFIRLGLHGETIGVMVFTTPKVLDAGRNQVFPHLKPNQTGRDTKLMNVARTRWTNANVLLSSRTVLDTMYRGAGLAYRFKNVGYRMTGYRYIESRSSMSRFNPFSEKAGMKFVQPKAASAQEHGLQFFSRHFVSQAFDYIAVMDELKSMTEEQRGRALAEMRDFYYRHSSMEKSGDKRLLGHERVDTLETAYLLRQVMQLTFGATVYAVFVNPDYGVKLPARIPLTAFDNQSINGPLRLDLL